MVLLWIGPLIFFAHLDRQARTYSLLYELDPSQEADWNDLSSRFSRLASAQAMWRVAAIVGTTDWKRNAGATQLYNRVQATLTLKSPPYIVTNITPWCLQLNDQCLYFFPDRLLVLQGKQFGVVEYDALNISATLEDFIESQCVPGDAQVVGSTWEHPNKDGSPDRRFASNRQVPIARYARLVFGSPSGLNIHLHVSSQVAAQAFAGWRAKSSHQAPYHQAQARPVPPNYHHQQTQQSQKRAYNPGEAMGYTGQTYAQSQSRVGPPPPGSQPKTISPCYETLGLRPDCTKDEAAKVYRNLARMYHPDLLQNLPNNLLDIAQERMKEINVAYTDLRALNGW